MKQLEVLVLDWNKLTSVPSCIGELILLKQLLLENSPELTWVPLSLFGLQNLNDFSLFRSNINSTELLYHNLPDDIYLDDTAAIDRWLNETFYWMQFNPILFHANSKTAL